MLEASDVNERTLCFLREIEDIHEHIRDTKASKYIDLNHSSDGTLKIDDEAEQLLNRLKYERIPRVLEPKNIYTYKLRWNSRGINRQTHVEYINRFNQDFYEAIKQQIDRCISSSVTTTTDPLQHEILEHAIQCKTYVSKFHGRTDVLNHVRLFSIWTFHVHSCLIIDCS
jgi:hypothetical protein